MTESSTFVGRTSGGGCYALILVVGVFPLMAIANLLMGGDPRVAAVGGALVLGLVAVALAVWQLIREEHRLELGPGGVRFVQRQTWFGVPRPETVLFEAPLDATSRVTQVNTRAPSSKGGWNHGSHLVFPGEHKVTDDLLGSRAVPSSEYNRLLQALQARLGDRFSVEERV